jgi:hypothetical protein
VSCSLRDAVNLEARGVPAVVLCTTPFLNAATAHARLLGRSDLRPVEVPHPLVSLHPQAVRERAEAIIDAIVEQLLSR